MDPKTLFVPIAASAPETNPLVVATALAREFGSHVECDFVETRNDVVDVRSMTSPTQMEAYQKEEARRAGLAQRQAESIETVFTRHCREAGIVVLQPSSPVPSGGPSAIWRRTRGDAANVAANRACAFDLTIAACPADSTSITVAQDVVEGALLRSGRPVLMVPRRLGDIPGEHAVIAWRPSVPAWRAVSGALPLLKRASAVTVLTVGERAADDGSGEALLSYLAMHGIHATRRVVEPSGGVGESLLAAVRKEDADLLVMGGYSHSRLREMLLTGPTRHVLTHATTTSILMAH